MRETNYNFLLRITFSLVFVISIVRCSDAFPLDSCELLQMQALANGKPVACSTCHRPAAANLVDESMYLSLVDFLSNPSVQKQIELTSDQLDELKKIRTKSKLQRGSTNELDSRAKDERALEGLLIPYQVLLVKRLRFNDMVAKYGFAWTVSNRPFVEDIGTTKTQKTELLKIKEEAEKEIESTKLDSLNDFEKEALKILDSKQRKIVKSLMGKKVTIELTTLQRQMKFQTSKLDLLTKKAVKEDLGISASQAKKIESLYQLLRDSYKDIRQQKDLGSGEMKKRFIEKRNEIDEELEKTLLRHQWVELENTQFAWFVELFGFDGAIRTSPFKEKIDVTDRQLNKIRILQQKQNSQTGDDSEEIRIRARRKMLSTFNRKQRDIIKELQNQSKAAQSFRL